MPCKPKALALARQIIALRRTELRYPGCHSSASRRALLSSSLIGHTGTSQATVKAARASVASANTRFIREVCKPNEAVYFNTFFLSLLSPSCAAHPASSIAGTRRENGDHDQGQARRSTVSLAACMACWFGCWSLLSTFCCPCGLGHGPCLTCPCPCCCSAGPGALCRGSCSASASCATTTRHCHGAGAGASRHPTNGGAHRCCYGDRCCCATDPGREPPHRSRRSPWAGEPRPHRPRCPCHHPRSCRRPAPGASSQHCHGHASDGGGGDAGRRMEAEACWAAGEVGVGVEEVRHPAGCCRWLGAWVVVAEAA